MSVLILLLLFVLAPMRGVCGTQDLRITLSTPQHDYVVREPIKFVVSMKNVGPETIRIVEVFYLKCDANMRHFFIEIETPWGKLERRNHLLVVPTEIINKQYNGEPLAPGDSIEVFLYPNFTVPVEPPGLLSARGEGRVTFPEAGTYRVRVAYFVPEYFVNLWRGENGIAYSNWVELRFRDPTPEEKEILDVIWESNPQELSSGDDTLIPSFNELSLKRVIANYPDNPLIKYAYFNLARQIMSLVGGARNGEAVPIFEMLIERYPDFRYEEVRQHLAKAYFYSGQPERARELMRRTLRERPNLRHHDNFMMRKLSMEEPTGIATIKWRKLRRKGIRIDDGKKLREGQE